MAVIVRKVRRVRIVVEKKVEQTEQAPELTDEAKKKQKLAKQAENRRKNLQMMMALQMQAAAEEGAPN
jgi:hypothetical protein